MKYPFHYPIENATNNRNYWELRYKKVLLVLKIFIITLCSTVVSLFIMMEEKIFFFAKNIFHWMSVLDNVTLVKY